MTAYDARGKGAIRRDIASRGVHLMLNVRGICPCRPTRVLIKQVRDSGSMVLQGHIFHTDRERDRPLLIATDAYWQGHGLKI
jgi:hypothetical protein